MQMYMLVCENVKLRKTAKFLWLGESEEEVREGFSKSLFGVSGMTIIEVASMGRFYILGPGE